MEVLEINTIITTLIVISYICAIMVLGNYFMFKKHYSGMKWFLISYLLFVVGMTEAGFVNKLPPFVGIVLPNLSMYCAILSILFGMQLFVGLTIKYRNYILPIIIFILFYSYFSIIRINVNARIIVFSIFASLTYARIAFISLKKFENRIKSTTRMMTAVGLIASSWYLFRAFDAIYSSKISSYYFAGNRDAFWVLGLLSLVLFQTFALLTIIQKRLIYDLRTVYRDREDLLEKLKIKAYTDELTDICNRRKIEESINSNIERYLRYETVFSILMIDIDYFKSVNDNFGHDAGDKVLKELSASIKRNIRGSDFVGRWGGEEFIVILPETDIISASMVAEKLRKVVESMGVENGNDFIKITISIGVAEYNGIGDMYKLIKLVDMRMYRAKSNGRNCVVNN